MAQGVHAPSILGRTPLHDASWGGHPDVIRSLLEYCADVVAQDEYQITQLHLTADQEKVAAAQLLLKLGAVVHVRNELGRTPRCRMKTP